MVVGCIRFPFVSWKMHAYPRAYMRQWCVCKLWHNVFCFSKIWKARPVIDHLFISISEIAASSRNCKENSHFITLQHELSITSANVTAKFIPQHNIHKVHCIYIMDSQFLCNKDGGMKANKMTVSAKIERCFLVRFATSYMCYRKDICEAYLLSCCAAHQPTTL